MKAIGIGLLVLGGLIGAFGLTGSNSGDGGALDFEIDNGDPFDGGGGCICPHVYDPVVCVAPSSGKLSITTKPEKRQFSNACEAGCAGFTRCRPA